MEFKAHKRFAVPASFLYCRGRGRSGARSSVRRVPAALITLASAHHGIERVAQAGRSM